MTGCSPACGGEGMAPSFHFPRLHIAALRLRSGRTDSQFSVSQLFSDHLPRVVVPSLDRPEKRLPSAPTLAERASRSVA
jgi:hypothetical protein